MNVLDSSSRGVLCGLLALTLALTVTACDSLLDTEPAQEVETEAVLTDSSGLQALLVSAYDDFQDATGDDGDEGATDGGYYGQEYMLYPDALADNAINIPGVARYDGPPVNAVREHLTRWGGHYITINKTNNILANISNENLEASEGFRNRLRGEALFIRAINYFDLMRTKAYEPGVVSEGWTEGVVIRTEPTGTLEGAREEIERSSIDDVYSLIEEDLLQAITLLEQTEPLFSEATGANQKFVANEAAAQALLAQVYLYAKRYAEAADMATTALETAREEMDADLLTEDEYVDAFFSETTSSGIFVVEMDPDFDTDATSVNESLSSLTYDINSFNFQLLPTDDLIDAHEEGDVRLGLYEETEQGTRIAKYTQANGSYADNVIVIRAAEVLLIRAEARVESGDEGGAREDLNRLRTARGLESVSPSGGNLIDEILRQKRLELAFEGERFFDLKRRGMDIPKPQASFEVLPYDDYRILSLIPQDAIESNASLEQNPGY